MYGNNQADCEYPLQIAKDEVVYLTQTTLNDIYAILSEYDKRKRENKNYNIFKVLEITNREILMCRVLADFLNPRGEHGKGDKYLKIFLEKILHRDDYEKICESAYVFKEYPIAGDRRIDIVIESVDVFIPIEVKIYAADQKAQCYDYYMYAAKRDSAAKVIYLTKWGDMPSRCSISSVDGRNIILQENIQCISFTKDIINFMDMIIESEEEVIIRETAQQYKDAIKEFTVSLDEELKVEIANRLCENKQNFRSMLAIEQAADKAKAKLMYSLFEEFETSFFSIKDKYSLKDELRFDWFDYKTQAVEQYYAQNDSTYPGINYVFSDILLPKGIELWFRIEIDNNLFAGICLFDTINGQELCISEQNKLSQEIIETLHKYINFTENRHKDWWVQYWYLPTAYDNTKLAGNEVPNFKAMNEAAVALADRENRKKFVKDCMVVIERILNRICIKDKNYK